MVCAVVAAAVVTVGSTTAAGAGSGPPGSMVLVSAKDKALTKAQLITKADALCADARQALAPQLSKFAGIKSHPAPTQIAAFVDALSTVVQSQLSKTRALTPPKSEQAEFSSMVRDDQADLTKLKADPQLLATSKTDPFLTADNLARKLGFEGAPGSGECSKPQSTTSG